MGLSLHRRSSVIDSGSVAEEEGESPLSATVDAEYIRDFFNEPTAVAEKGKDKAAILSVEGTNYSVDVHYLKEPCADYVKCCVDTVLKLHAVEPPGDILVFLTGMDEVDHCVSLLKVHKSILVSLSMIH